MSRGRSDQSPRCQELIYEFPDKSIFVPTARPALVSVAVVDPRESYVEYELSLDEILAFNNFYQGRSPAARTGFRRAMLLLAMLLLTGGTVLALVIRRLAPDLVPLLVVPFAILGLLLLLIYPAQYRRLVRKTVERHDRQDNMGTMFGPRRLTLTPDYVITSTPYSQTITRWSGLVEVCVEPEAVYLFTSAMQATIVPRRLFADESEFRRFGSIAQTSVERAKLASVQLDNPVEARKANEQYRPPGTPGGP